jgi:CRISPR-associated protein Cmr4
MFKKAKLFFLLAETPLHPGSGGDSTGIVDLPIQRERYTNFPKIEASSLKGSLREAFSFANKEIQINGQKIRPLDKVNNEQYLSLVFGPENSDESYASAISFLDARILLFPVKSLKGIFAWITCPMVLERFIEDLKFMEFSQEELINHGFMMENLSSLENTVPESSNLLINNNVVILEEYTFQVKENPNTKKIAEFIAQNIFKENEHSFWKEKLKKDLIILSDDDFEQFVTNSTEIITRTKIDDKTGTVETGALWTEEYLPQETIFYSIAFSSPIRSENKGLLAGKDNNTDEEAEKVMSFFEGGLPKVIQIGGNQTLGKGIVRIQILQK